MPAHTSYTVITAAQISNATAAGRGLITTLATPVGVNNVVLISPANVGVIIQGLTDSGLVTPVTSAQVVDGVVIVLT